MFRKWLVTAIVSGFLAVGVLGCDKGETKKTDKPKTEGKAKTEKKGGTETKAKTEAKMKTE